MSAEKVILHHVQYSRSFRVLWLLAELGIEPELVQYRIGDKSMREGDLPRMSPAMRVPALEIDGITMAESGAIVEYLCETRGDAFHRPVGHGERVDFLQWIHFAETQAGLIEQLNLMHVFLRPPATPGPALVKITTARLKASIAGMEARMGDHDWLLPTGFSGADVMMGFNLFAAPYFVHMAQFPKAQAYADRIAARSAYQQAVAREGEQTFYNKPFYPVPEA